LRQNADKSGLAISSYGSLILDMRFDAKMDAKQLNDVLNSISGIVEHGIFYALATTVLIGKAGQIQTLQAG
jgi:ribose 5-phosphate isomerase A